MKKIISCLLIINIFAISLMGNVPVVAEENINKIIIEEDVIENEWITNDGNYEYPIDHYDDDWYQLETVVEIFIYKKRVCL